jgi:Tripartite tricarboxylate transporter family receptor
MSEHRLKALQVPCLSMWIGGSIDVKLVDDCLDVLKAAFRCPRWKKLPQQERIRLVGRLCHPVPTSFGRISARSRPYRPRRCFQPAHRRMLCSARRTSITRRRNVAFEYRKAENHYDRLLALAVDLVRRGVAPIFTAANVIPPLAAKAASRVTPIVFFMGANLGREPLTARREHHRRDHPRRGAFWQTTGAAAAVNVLLREHVTSGLITYAAEAEHLKDGKLRALATASRTRIEPLPDVPAVAKSGYKDYEAEVRLWLFAPAKTPRRSSPSLSAG